MSGEDLEQARSSAKDARRAYEPKEQASKAAVAVAWAFIAWVDKWRT